MNTRTRIKFCGITSVDDAKLAVTTGADAVGLVFYAASPRNVELALAKQIAESVPAFVTIVALFVNATQETIQSVINEVRIDLLQFHGEETPEFCSGFNKPYMKALRIKDGADILSKLAPYKNAAAILLDAWHPELSGGSGQTIDWDMLPELENCHVLKEKLVLAGGLTPENVSQAIETVKPYAVDVSTGIEKAPGVKDLNLMQAFVNSVNNKT